MPALMRSGAGCRTSTPTTAAESSPSNEPDSSMLNSHRLGCACSTVRRSIADEGEARPGACWAEPGEQQSWLGAGPHCGTGLVPCSRRSSGTVVGTVNARGHTVAPVRSAACRLALCDEMRPSNAGLTPARLWCSPVNERVVHADAQFVDRAIVHERRVERCALVEPSRLRGLRPEEQAAQDAPRATRHRRESGRHRVHTAAGWPARRSECVARARRHRSRSARVSRRRCLSSRRDEVWSSPQPAGWRASPIGGATVGAPSEDDGRDRGAGHPASEPVARADATGRPCGGEELSANPGRRKLDAHAWGTSIADCSISEVDRATEANALEWRRGCGSGVPRVPRSGSASVKQTAEPP